MIQPTETDKLFSESPDAGHPECYCSRCNAHITSAEAPILRIFCEPETEEEKEKYPGGAEYRYCDNCAKQMGVNKHPDIAEFKNAYDEAEYGDDERDDYEDDYNDRDDDEDDFEEALQNCGQIRGGGCMKAGSEECDFECPFSAAMYREASKKRDSKGRYSK
jgi:hypothetical protein